MSKNSYVYELLEQLRNKGCCTYTQDKAIKLFRELKQSSIDPIDYRNISIEHSHWEIGEGAEKFYNIINKVKEKYL